MTSIPYIPAQEQPEHYLNAKFDIKSWLLPVDHKRIAVLYLISVTVFFIVGGLAAVLMRLELMTPAGDLVQALRVEQVAHHLPPAKSEIHNPKSEPLCFGISDFDFGKVY